MAGRISHIMVNKRRSKYPHSLLSLSRSLSLYMCVCDEIEHIANFQTMKLVKRICLRRCSVSLQKNLHLVCFASEHVYFEIGKIRNVYTYALLRRIKPNEPTKVL